MYTESRYLTEFSRYLTKFGCSGRGPAAVPGQRVTRSRTPSPSPTSLAPGPPGRVSPARQRLRTAGSRLTQAQRHGGGQASEPQAGPMIIGSPVRPLARNLLTVPRRRPENQSPTALQDQCLCCSAMMPRCGHGPSARTVTARAWPWHGQCPGPRGMPRWPQYDGDPSPGLSL